MDNKQNAQAIERRLSFVLALLRCSLECSMPDRNLLCSLEACVPLSLNFNFSGVDESKCLIVILKNYIIFQCKKCLFIG